MSPTRTTFFCESCIISTGAGSVQRHSVALLSCARIHAFSCHRTGSADCDLLVQVLDSYAVYCVSTAALLVRPKEVHQHEVRRSMIAYADAHMLRVHWLLLWHAPAHATHALLCTTMRLSRIAGRAHETCASCVWSSARSPVKHVLAAHDAESAVQHVYMLIVGGFPFNAYLAGLGASLGGATLSSAPLPMNVVPKAHLCALRPHAIQLCLSYSRWHIAVEFVSRSQQRTDTQHNVSSAQSIGSEHSHVYPCLVQSALC